MSVYNVTVKVVAKNIADAIGNVRGEVISVEKQETE